MSDKLKPVKAWALVMGSQIECFDYRVPIYWLKRSALKDAKSQTIGSRIARVEIREIPKRTKRK